MTQADLLLPMLLGLPLGGLLVVAMRWGHILPVALNWGGAVPPGPAVLETSFAHPKYGPHHRGYRVKYCRDDGEIADTILRKWCRLPDGTATEPYTREDVQ